MSVEVSDHGFLLPEPPQTCVAEAVDVLMNPKDPLQARWLPLVGRLLNLEGFPTTTLEEPDQGLRVGQGRESVRQAALISHIPGGGFKRPQLLITLYVQNETPFEEFIGPESG